MINLEYIIVKEFGFILPVGMDGESFLSFIFFSVLAIFVMKKLLTDEKYKHPLIEKFIDKVF